MKQFKILNTFLFLFILHSICLGQIKSMGFTQKVPGLLSWKDYCLYYPKLQIMNDTLFVNSATGVYQKDMLKDSEWELYAFKDAPVIEFVRNGNKLLANAISTTNGKDSLLVLSLDGGKSYEDYTAANLFEYGRNHLYSLSQNPKNPNSLLTATTFYGLYRSGNFGEQWQSLYPYSLGIDIAHASFHPLDTTTIYYCGEGLIFNGIIYKSSDDGNTWSKYEVPGGDNCVHWIDFHPTDPNILVFGGEGKIGKSTDKGETWKVADLYDTGMYFTKVLIDKENPQIVYASGSHGAYKRDNQDTIWVYRSTDTGDTWHLAYKEYLGANGGGTVDMVKYKDKLIFYTRELGVLELDVKKTPVIPTGNSGVKRYDLIIYPNPMVNTMHFQTDKSIQSIDIIDLTGCVVLRSVFCANENTIDVSNLKTGIYSAVFNLGEQRIVRKICIKH